MAKRAVITGGGSGIGRSCAHLLAEKGYEVIIVGRSEANLKETAETSQGPGLIIPKIMDISKRDAHKGAFDDIDSVDIFIASAGVCAQGRLDEEDADDVWERTMATNVDGVWYMFRELHNKLSQNGRAVVVSSGLGKLGRHGYGAYTASKHAVLGLVKCFAKELAPRQITVNAVCPGWVDTKMARADLVHTAQVHGTTPEAERKAAEEAITLKRFVTADEVAQLILFLASQAAGGITGQAYNISGGEFFA